MTIYHYLDYYTRDGGLTTALRQYQERHGTRARVLFIRTGTTLPEPPPDDLEVIYSPQIPAFIFAFDVPELAEATA